MNKTIDIVNELVYNNNINIDTKRTNKRKEIKMNKQELTAKVRELKELKAMQEELQAEITTIEDEIKAIMTEQDTTELVVDVFKIRWTPVVSNRFDTTAFKKVYTDLYSQFTKTVESKRFSIA